MPAHICVTCGVQQRSHAKPPRRCPICSDERQYVDPRGQSWTTREQMQGRYRNQLTRLEPDLYRIRTRPAFGIGQDALLVRTPEGNLLWDCLGHLDQATVEAVSALGGIAAIAISHPHFYGSLGDWSEQFDAPVYLSERDRPYLARPCRRVIHFPGDVVQPLPGLRMLRLGGHFHGSCVLLWPAGAGGRGALLTGDTIGVVADRRWVTFLYSYPNRIPLPAGDVASIARRIENLAFDRIYDAWAETPIPTGARQAVLRSCQRYQRMLDGSWPRG